MKNQEFFGQKIQIYMFQQIYMSLIMGHFGHKGTIKGIRYLKNQSIIPIIEFNDNIRIWMLKNEIRDN